MHITTHVIWEITTSNQHMWHMTTRFQLIFTSCILTNPTDPENKRIYSQKKHALYIYRRKIVLKKACFFYMLIWLSYQKTFSYVISPLCEINFNFILIVNFHNLLFILHFGFDNSSICTVNTCVSAYKACFLLILFFYLLI